MAREQLIGFGIFLGTNALLAFVSFAFNLQTQALPAGQEMPEAFKSMPSGVLGTMNAGLIIVSYGLLGLAGLWFAQKLGLPGVFREGAGWRMWVFVPLGLGVVAGVLMVVVDQLCAAYGDWGGLPHPGFPMSLLASGTAGIGEEIVFRMFIMGLWAFLLNLVLQHWGATGVALWVSNVITALIFALGHLPAVGMLFGFQNPFYLPPAVLVDVFALNALVGLLAGALYMREGLVAAVGVHAWADIVWHVIWPLLKK